MRTFMPMCICIVEYISHRRVLRVQCAQFVCLRTSAVGPKERGTQCQCGDRNIGNGGKHENIYCVHMILTLFWHRTTNRWGASPCSSVRHRGKFRKWKHLPCSHCSCHTNNMNINMIWFEMQTNDLKGASFFSISLPYLLTLKKKHWTTESICRAIEQNVLLQRWLISSTTKRKMFFPMWMKKVKCNISSTRHGTAKEIKSEHSHYISQRICSIDPVDFAMVSRHSVTLCCALMFRLTIGKFVIGFYPTLHWISMHPSILHKATAFGLKLIFGENDLFMSHNELTNFTIITGHMKIRRHSFKIPVGTIDPY